MKDFTRKFIVVSDLENYKNLLIDKANEANKKIDVVELTKLFEKLKSSKDCEEICEKLKLFNEEKILIYSKYINHLLELSDAEIYNILNTFNYPNDNKYNIFDLITKMESDYKKILEEELLQAISFKNIEIDEIVDIANKYENKVNKYMIIFVNEKFYSMYQDIAKYPVLLELFYKLNNSIGKFSRDFIINYAGQKRKKSRSLYSDYKNKKIITEIRKRS